VKFISIVYVSFRYVRMYVVLPSRMITAGKLLMIIIVKMPSTQPLCNT